MRDMLEIYLNQMAIHLLNNNLTLFIGAGFSRLFNYPSWRELLQQIICDYELENELIETSLYPSLSESDSKNHDEMNGYIQDNLFGVDYLRLAGYINHVLKRDHRISIHEAIKKKIIEYEASRKNNDDIEKLKMFFQNNKDMLEDIITTNYDTNIEYCFNNEISVIHRDLGSLNRLSFKNKVFKIHGCVNDENNSEDTIIITEKDYNNFISKNKYLFYKVYSFFTEKKIVFIGYSINDPNIRSVLNDVIEENNNKVSLEIYWVTWDKMKELDKTYYEEQFNIRIIEECQIVEFFDKLQEMIDVNAKLKSTKQVNKHHKKLIDEFRMNYSDILNIERIIRNNMEDMVFSSLYNDLITERNNIYLEPYLYLLSKVSLEKSRTLKTYIQTIFELKKSLVYDSVRFMINNNEVYERISELDISDMLINSLLRYANGHHAFGEYADSIECLLKTYFLFREKLSNNDDFYNALVYNINSSTNSTRMDFGADWRGLERLSEFAYMLSEKDVIKLVDDLSGNTLTKLQIIRVETTIENARITEEQKLSLKYKYVKRIQLHAFFRKLLKETFGNHIDDSIYMEKDTYKVRGIKVELEYMADTSRDLFDVFRISHNAFKIAELEYSYNVSFNQDFENPAETEEFYVELEAYDESFEYEYESYESLIGDKDRFCLIIMEAVNEYIESICFDELEL